MRANEHVAGLIARKTVVYQAMVAERDVLYPGAANFVRDCAQRFPLMIATGTLRAEAEAILRRAGLRELFLDIIAAEDVERGKPEPDGFIAALGRIGFLLRQRDPVLADECLVVEDTQAGIEAAHRAGMKVLALCHMRAGERARGGRRRARIDFRVWISTTYSSAAALRGR